MITLTPEQREAVQKMASSPTNSALNISPLGSGKTVMAVELIRKLEAQVVLIIGPLGVYTGWKKTIEGQGIGLPVRKIDSKSEGMKAFTDYQFGEPGIYFVGRELFQRWSWEGRKRTKTWSSIKTDVVIFDESHRAQNRSSKTYKALTALKPTLYRLCLSATPTGNNFEGAWSTACWLFPEQVDHSYWRWVDQYCKTEYDPFSASKKKVVGERDPGKFYNSLPCVIKIEPQLEDETPKQVVYTDEVVRMLPEQERIYKQFENGLAVYLGEHPLVTEIPITHRIRLREIALGVPSLTEDDEVYFMDGCQSAKIDRILEILESSQDRVLIATHSKKFARVLRNRINEYFRYKDERMSALHTGDQDQKTREEARAMFSEGRVHYLVTTIPSMAEGIDGLQYATNKILLVSRDDNRMLMEQFVGRINRRGQSQQVRLHELKTEGSIDQGIYGKQVEEALKMRESLNVR